MPNFKKIRGNIADLEKERFLSGEIIIKNGKIFKIEKISGESKNYILPGFVNSHCHIESSFLSPAVYGALAISHGTVAAIADCHEIANVLGEKGILWMLKSAEDSPFRFFWALPSCVPATPFETTPNRIGPKEIKKLLRRKEFIVLGEMMNFPGVINKDKEVLEKIRIARELKKPIDGHCPGLSGKDLKKYISAGISTDHECTNLKEAKEKQRLGMKIQIRDGSAAKNLKDLIGLDYDRCFLVTDDLEVKDLLEGELNEVIRRAVKLGVPFFKAIKMVTKNPADHYGVNFGEIKIGKEANLVEFDNLTNLSPQKVWIKGKLVFQNGKLLFPVRTKNLETAIKVRARKEKDLQIKVKGEKNKVEVIEIVPSQIITKAKKLIPDSRKDVLKIAVINRYGREYIGLGFAKGFGLRKGALASSVSHDSHNLICVGTNDKDIAKAINILRKQGGFVFVSKNKISKVKLPLAGLMSNEDPHKLEKNIKKLEQAVRIAGCQLKNPLSQLSFLALLVIPELKISDKGLFDVKKFKFVPLLAS